MSGPTQPYGTLQPHPRHPFNNLPSRPVGQHTKSYTARCTDSNSPTQHFSSPMSTSAVTSPTISHSGSSAHHESESADESDLPDGFQIFSSCSSPQYPTHSWLDVSPICSVEPKIAYGKDRITFVEDLIWNSVDAIYAIYGEPSLRESGPNSSLPIETLLYEGLIHGLCNEIIILPIMSSIQQSHQGKPQQQSDSIPFPLFVAEMLRRMRASYFLLLIAMRFISDIKSSIQTAIDRSRCGWCRSGAQGCSHSNAHEIAAPSRFSKGRSKLAKAPVNDLQSKISSAAFVKTDPFSSLTDPRKAFLGALILANKFHRDRSIGNKSWATLIGLPLEEVHSAERAVGEALGWMLSRPWSTQETRNENGSISTDSTLVEPLFASNDAEVARYGVKALREAGTLPPPKRRSVLRSFSQDTYLARSPSSSSSFKTRPFETRPTPLRRATTVPSIEEQQLAGPQRQQPFLTPKKVNPLKKAHSIPYVLESSANGSEVVRDEMFDAIMNGTWTSENERDVSIDEFMEATPTLEQVRTKRKASEDFGPTRLLRCCGDGQRIPITSPGNTRNPTALVAPISTTKDEDCGETWEDDEDDCPTLSPGTPATTSPSVGLLTRMNTPQDILASVANETLGHHSIKGQLSARNLLEASSHHPHHHLAAPAYPLHH